MPDWPLVENESAFQIVTAPVFPETAIPVPAEVDETKLAPRLFCFELKVDQSALERYPETDAVDVGCENVQVADEDEMAMPDDPEVPKVAASHRVRFVERSPPPANPPPALTVVEDETALFKVCMVVVAKAKVHVADEDDTWMPVPVAKVPPNHNVRSAERSPPP